MEGIDLSVMLHGVINLLLIGGVAFALKSLDVSKTRKVASIGLFSAVLFGWYGLAAKLGKAGVFASEPDRISPIGFAIVVPIAIGYALFRWWRPWREIVAASPLAWLIGIQLFRIQGVMFLWNYYEGLLPGEFAFPAGIGDILIGLTAIPVAIALARHRSGAERWATIWNWLGIFDLVLAVTLGFLTSPSPIQQLAFDRPNPIGDLFPLVMIPINRVPIAILLHLYALWILRHPARSDSAISS